MSGFFFFFFSPCSLVTVLPSIEDLVYRENESEEESVILKESNEETITSSTAMSRRTEDSATGSVVGKIDEGTSQCNYRFCSEFQKNLFFIIIIKEINNF